MNLKKRVVFLGGMVMLKAELQRFIDRVVHLNHLHSLISKEKILITFECEHQFLYLSIFQNQCQLSKIQNPSISLNIKGGLDALHTLVNGKWPLQKLIKEKQLDVHAAYRSQLLLESIFILAREH